VQLRDLVVGLGGVVVCPAVVDVAVQAGVLAAISSTRVKSVRPIAIPVRRAGSGERAEAGERRTAERRTGNRCSVET